jgi:hypothetical protein
MKISYLSVADIAATVGNALAISRVPGSGTPV